MKPIEDPFVQDLKNLSRKQRHDYMNTFQIIYGYLQLNKTEKAIEQVKKVTRMSQNISKLHNLSVFSIALFLERKLIQASNIGFDFNIEVETHSDKDLRQIKNDIELIEIMGKMIDYLFDQYKEDIQYDVHFKIVEYLNGINIVIYEDEYMDVHDVEKDLKKIHKDVKISNGDIVISFSYDEVKNLQAEESIYSKIYSNTI